jgi:chromosome segregation ATPase
MRANGSMMLLVALLETGLGLQLPATARFLRTTPALMAIDGSILREVAVYDSEMEAKIMDLEKRVQSADWNAAQQRELVGKAQADLWKQEEMRQELKTEVASLTEAKAAVEEAKAAVESEKAAAEAQLESKSKEVATFVDTVEKELNEAREQVKTLSADLTSVKAELAERTTEVDNLNVHLEAHTSATLKLKDEVAELKKELAAAKAAE